MKVYTVLRSGWEYNDNYMYRIDGESVEKIFQNKKNAENFCKDENINDLIERFRNNIFEYAENGLDDIFDYSQDKVEERLLLIVGQEIFDKLMSPSFESIELNRSQAEELLKIINPNFIDNFVSEYEVEDNYLSVENN